MTERGLPPLNWLRAFEAAARRLSFTEAARELNITQAAVSKHVKALELELRHPLFHRHPRSLELTKSGEAYLPKVQDALDRLAIGTREVFGRRRSEALTIRCAVSFAVNWLAPRLPGFLRRHPDTPIRLLSSVWSDPFDAAAYDLDIQYGTGHWQGLKSQRLTRESITPLCDAATAQRLHSPVDLQTERLLHVMGYQEGWGIWLKAAGVADIDAGQGLQVDTSLAAFALAAHGAGIALGRSSLSGKDKASGTLLQPFALDVQVEEGFFLLEPQTPDVHPDAKDFTAWISEMVARERSEALAAEIFSHA
jgi:LysR family transcriptional regulator, glycine cleavage system transcriptional activator